MAGSLYDPRKNKYPMSGEAWPEQERTAGSAQPDPVVSAAPARQPVRTDSWQDTVADVTGRLASGWQYADPMRDALQGKARAVAEREPFSYDPAVDPAWQAYRKQYTREGRRASEDTLGQYAAMTGGMPSTAAVTAASQAGDYYAAQMADKLPELYRLAYDMYAQDAARDVADLNALRGYSGDLYGRWADEYGRLGGLYDLAGSERAYQDRTEAAKLYAYGDGAPYEIGSAKGRYFVQNAAPGQSMTGGDGSRWTKNADGSVTIARGGQTWRAGGAAESTGSGRSGGGGAAAASGSGEPTVNMGDVEALGYGPISMAKVWDLVDSGEVAAWQENGQWRFRRVRQPAPAREAPSLADGIANRNARLGLA